MDQGNTYARPPFNNPAADIVVRSRDGVNFRVRSAIVAEASPIFSDMFEIPQPAFDGSPESPDHLDGKPVVEVEEDHRTLDHLLRLCYPTADPELSALGDVRAVLAAALKYEMEEAVALMKKALLGFVSQQPLSVWASACILRLGDETRVAANALIDHEDQLPREPPPELQDISSAEYFRLIKFLRARGNVGEQFSFYERGSQDTLTKRSRSDSHHKPSSIEYRHDRPFVDILCRSSDGREFLTHKIILCTASPILKDRILNLPPPTAPALPVLQLDVLGAPFSSLLEICYPCDNSPEIGELPIAHAVEMARIAQTLKMHLLIKRLRYDAFSWHKVRKPMETYLLASNVGLTDIANDALGFIHSDPLQWGYVPEMEVTSATAYHRLIVNRLDTVAVAAKLTASATPRARGAQKAASDASLASAKDQRLSEETPRGHPWLLGLLEKKVQELSSPCQDENWWAKPNTTATLEEATERKVWCNACADNIRIVLRIEKLHEEVRYAMSENNVSTPLLTVAGDRVEHEPLVLA